MLWQFLLGALAFLKSSPTIIQETEQWGPTTPEEQGKSPYCIYCPILYLRVRGRVSYR